MAQAVLAPRPGHEFSLLPLLMASAAEMACSCMMTQMALTTCAR